jgi:hypothetical protein
MGATRKTIREALAAIFVAADDFNVVYAYAPVDLQGMDEVLCIYSDTSQHVDESYASQHNFYTFTLDVYVKRASGETTEDTLDTLHEAIRSTIRANRTNANWDWISLEEPSDAYFAEISGRSYRVESHKLSLKETT